MSLARIQGYIRQLDDPQQGIYARTDRQKWEQMKVFVGSLAKPTPAEQPAPAAVEGPSDLRTRCEEILAWRKTGVLPGEALRTLAREKYGDEYDAIQRAERDTETEALNFVVAAPTTQPAPQQEAQEPAYPSLPPADEVVHPRTSEPYALWGLIKLMDYAKAYHAANAPQPVERKPLTDEQWQRIADLTNSILTRATKDEIERVIGIKGGQNADT